MDNIFDMFSDDGLGNVPENVDLNGDGIYDGIVSYEDFDNDNIFESIVYSEDINGDGYADIEAIEMDQNLDGVVDYFESAAMMDYDGDGVAEQMEYYMEQDINGDGIVDMVHSSYAMDNDLDGYIDYAEATTGVDTNSDGYIDYIETSVGGDMDGDGVPDYFHLQIDQNGDGYAESSLTTMNVDTDGDGVADTVYYMEDFDNDGNMDKIETEVLMENDEIVFPEEEECYSDGYQQFDASETDMDQVVGDPGDESCWEYQGESGPCAIYAQVMAYEGITGTDIDVEEMIDVATDAGWYNGSGTSIADMDKILNYLGAETEFGMNGDMDDIRECLENGGRVVVAVDGNEIWFGDSEMFAPNEPNHAITVIGIDYSGEEPMVIINDSGTPDGHAIMVPESQFMDAWEDSSCSYVEAYA